MYLREITLNDHVWKDAARREYHIDVGEDFDGAEINQNIRSFYIQILMQYGPGLLKIWQRSNFEHYGGLAKLVYHQRALYLVLLDPPPFPHIKECLQPQIMCQVYLGSTGQIVTNGCDSLVKSIFKFTISKDKLALDCMTVRNRRRTYFPPFVKRFGLKRFLFEEEEEIKDRYNDYMNYMIKGLQEYSPIPLNHLLYHSTFSFCPLTPGFFKGTHSINGIEIIEVSYCGWLCFARKITGDPNIPFGKRTFSVHIKSVIHFPEEAQSSIFPMREYMKTSQDTDIGVLSSMVPSLSPFQLPVECDCDASLDDPVFETYIWQIKAHCQVAETGFTNPTMMDALLIIFSDDIFGLLQFDMAALQLYSRVKENLEGTHFTDLFPTKQPSDFI